MWIMLGQWRSSPRGHFRLRATALVQVLSGRREAHSAAPSVAANPRRRGHIRGYAMTTIQRVDAKMKGFAQRQAEREQQRRERQGEKRRLYSNALPRHLRSEHPS